MNKLGIIWLMLALMMQPANCLGGMLTYSGSTTYEKIPVLEISERQFQLDLERKTNISSSVVKTKIEILERIIVKNSSRFIKDPEGRRKLAVSFLSAEIKYGIPANILQAIAFVESSYYLNAVNSRSKDYGLMQVNRFNIRAYGFNKKKLLTNLDYSVKAGTKVFKWFYDRYPLEEAIKRYNCGVRKQCVNYRSVKTYLRKVKKAL